MIFTFTIVFFMWRCASASATRSSHKQYERSEIKDVHKHHLLLAFWDVMLCYIASGFDVFAKS